MLMFYIPQSTINFRSLVAKGKAENNKGYAPKAANMKKLVSMDISVRSS